MTEPGSRRAITNWKVAGGSSPTPRHSSSRRNRRSLCFAVAPQELAKGDQRRASQIGERSSSTADWRCARCGSVPRESGVTANKFWRRILWVW